MTETLTDLLNKVEAIFKAMDGSRIELEKFIGHRRQRISEWVVQRKHEPPGAVALQMQAWAAKMTTRIAIGPRTLQVAYRDAHKMVKERRK